MSRCCSSSLNFILQASFFFLQTCNVFWGSSLLTDELQLLKKSLLLFDELKTVPVCFSHSWPRFIIQQGQLLLYIRNSLQEEKYISKCRRERQEEKYQNVKSVDACAFFPLNIKPRKFRGVWEDYLFLSFGVGLFLKGFVQLVGFRGFFLIVLHIFKKVKQLQVFLHVQMCENCSAFIYYLYNTCLHSFLIL